MPPPERWLTRPPGAGEPGGEAAAFFRDFSVCWTGGALPGEEKEKKEGTRGGVLSGPAAAVTLAEGVRRYGQRARCCQSDL